jgi:hypothetical protein
MMRQFMHRALCLAILVAGSPLLPAAQECRLKFVVTYNDGKMLQVGLTPEQKKFWEREGAKHFKGMCLDGKEPNYIILWSEELSGAEAAKAAIDQFNRVRTTGEAPTTRDTNSSLMSATIYLRPTGAVREKADYWILDTSKTPYLVIRKGQAYQDVPFSRANQPGESVKASDVASTIADPAAAMENALKWLKKEKKL